MASMYTNLFTTKLALDHLVVKLQVMQFELFAIIGYPCDLHLNHTCFNGFFPS